MTHAVAALSDTDPSLADNSASERQPPVDAAPSTASTPSKLEAGASTAAAPPVAADGAPAPSPKSKPSTGPARGQRRPGADETTIAGRKGADFHFEPRESTVYVDYTVELRSDPMQVAFRRVFERSAMVLFEIDLILPILCGPNEDMALAVYNDTDHTFEKLEAYADNTTRQFENMIAENGVPTGAKFSQPFETSVRIYNPRMKRMLDLFAKFDNLVMLGSVLFIHGFFDGVQTKRMAFDARTRMTRLGKSLWHTHNRAIKALYRERDKARADARAVEDAQARKLAAARAARADEILSSHETRSADDDGDDMGGTELSAEMGRSVDDVIKDQANEETASTSKPRKATKTAAKKATKTRKRSPAKAGDDSEE